MSPFTGGSPRHEPFTLRVRSVHRLGPLTCRYLDTCPSRRKLACLIMVAFVNLGTHAPNLSSKWSPTRKAFAIIVSEGFTALLETKKLASTT